jgi:hypothetical protein
MIEFARQERIAALEKRVAAAEAWQTKATALFQDLMQMITVLNDELGKLRQPPDGGLTADWLDNSRDQAGPPGES